MSRFKQNCGVESGEFESQTLPKVFRADKIIVGTDKNLEPYTKIIADCIQCIPDCIKRINLISKIERRNNTMQ